MRINKMNKIPLGIKVMAGMVRAVTFLLSMHTFSVKAASTDFYNGSGKYASAPQDNSTGTTINNTTYSWNSDDTCYYMETQLGWGKPTTFAWCSADGGKSKWISVNYSGYTTWNYPASTWVKIDGDWYFCDASGYIVKGWAYIPVSGDLTYSSISNSKYGWFYFDESTGAMQQGWQYIGKKWYYFNFSDTVGSGYYWGECLYNDSGFPDLVSASNSTYSYGGKTARYVTGFSFTVKEYLENDSGGYDLKSETSHSVDLGDSYTCEKTVSASIPTGYSLNTDKSSPASVTNSLILAKSNKMSAALTKTDVSWYYSRNSYTLTLQGNGGTVPTGTVTLKYNSTSNYDMETNIPTRNGYSFKGWYTKASGGTQIYNASGVAVNDGTYWKNNRNVYAGSYTLYAQWTAKTYTVTYNANGGILNGSSSASVTCGSSVNLSPKCTKDGMLFAGWGLSPADTKVISSYSMPASNVTLYALYSLPVSDMKEAVLVSWNPNNKAVYNSFPLSLSQTTNGTYHYSTGGLNLARGLSGSASDIKWAVLLYDNAGNYSVLNASDTELPPVPKQYLQTTIHYIWNMEADTWIYHASTSDLVYENSTYTPAYLETIPTGYHASSIDKPYRVSGDTTTKAYYEPDAYTLYFDPNGGSCDTASKTVYKDYFYGELPTAVRTGYTFEGWYSSPTGGQRISSSDRYSQNADSTIYAHWKINSHDVVYDYATNGGDGVDVSTKDTTYGSNVDLSIQAYKNGWEFIGWNTNPDATEGLKSCTMPDEHLVLYAIYRKDITAAFIDANDMDTITRDITVTIFNRDTEAAITVPTQNAVSNWTALGWSTSTKGNADVEVSSGYTIYLTENQTFYGCYVQEITLSYDTNGSAETIASQTMERFYNASDVYENPVYTIAKAPALSKHSFVKWEELGSTGEVLNSYSVQELAVIEKNTVLTAKWDKMPEIEAYDRYFTLEEAENNEITEDRLLEKVTATDKEDGKLVNGQDVIVKNPDQLDFVNKEEVTVTYQATDSFGNKVEKNITVHVVDTTVTESKTFYYARFISLDFFKDGENPVPEESGGLKWGSIWRTQETYSRLLENVLNNQKTEEEYKTIRYFGLDQDVKVAGSGTWNQIEETWVFTKSDIKAVEEFTLEHGLGNLKESDAVKMFFEIFGYCVK